MEEKTSLIPISSVDMLENNLSLKEHKILLEDCRSLLKFNNKQLKDVEKELYLFNDYIKIIFQFLKDIGLFDLKDHSSYEIMANEINWSLIIEMDFDILEMDLIKKIKENTLNLKLSYFEIKEKEKEEKKIEKKHFKIINNKFIDIYCIMKNVKTFTQRDDNIRQKLYQILFNETEGKTKQNILFIGGEMYGFLKILVNNYNIAYAITDFQGIKEDAEYNNPNIKVDLVNYDTFSFSFDKEKEPKMIEIQFDICIVNLLNGLGYNLIKELKKIKRLKKIIIISCKPKATQKDIKFIEEELKEFKLSLTDIYNLETTRQKLQIYILQNINAF
jgi:tRNA/tmRNA/rRNA uracil-C5-methylase (TrmA/RlmC/RlmD family)